MNQAIDYNDLYDFILRTSNAASRRYRVDEEECLSIAHVETAQALIQYDPAKGHLYPLVSTRIRNAVRDHMERTKNRNEVSFDVAHHDRPQEASSDVPDVDLSCLTSIERQAVQLRYWQSLTMREVAGRMNVAVGTCRSLIKAALDKLRMQLQAA